MRVAGTLGATGIRHDAVGAHVVAAAHDGNESGDAVLVRTHGRDVGISLVAGKENVDLGTVGRDGLQQPRQRPIGVRAHDEVHLLCIQQLVFQAFRHASNDAHHGSGTLLPLQVELLDPAPDPLFGIVPHRAGIGHDEVRFLHVLRPLISLLRQDGKDDLGVIDIHLTPVCFDIGFLHVIQR